MASQMHGAFCWHELMTSDLAAAKAFYEKVVGWGAQDAQMPGMQYWLMSAGGVPSAGMMAMPEDACDMGAKPGWIGYVAVDDVDAATEKVQRLGGKVHKAPMDIPNVGRFSVVADPQNTTFAMLTPAPQPDMPPPPPPGTPGRVGWNELYCSDVEPAFAFYADLFGWTKGEAMPMGEMGVYQIFHHGDMAIGAMMKRPPNLPVNFWNFYFNVPKIDAAAERAKEEGATILHGPMEVPGGDWIVQALDPQGAMFAIVRRRA
jgi:predicted enzyme related to lactoylglutathione lyase